MQEEQEMIEAIQEGSLERVSALIDARPGLVDARTHLGVPAALHAVYYGHPQIAELLRDRGANIDFWTACAMGSRSRVAALLDGDPALINRHAPDGFVPLALACFFGHDALAEFLLDRGADPNLIATDRMKLAPIHAAIARGNLPLVSLLITRGAAVNIGQEAGCSPLHSAAAGGHRDIADVLLERGADLTARMNGKTPAELARERGHIELANYLESRTATA